jgi:hypothetical protein
MSNKKLAAQRPLFADWPAWQTLPTEVRQSVAQLLAQLYLDIVGPCDNPNSTLPTSEQDDEQPTD